MDFSEEDTSCDRLDVRTPASGEEVTAMRCPRCGGKMSGGICEDCGFPATGRARKNRRYKRIKPRKEA